MLGGRRRRALILTAVSLGFSAGYLTWVQLSPPIG